MDLQSTFYVVGIVFMSLMLILFVVSVIALLVIRAKVNAIQRHIEEKFTILLSFFEAGSNIVDTVKNITDKRR
jgi:pilus assembly protein TadC